MESSGNSIRGMVALVGAFFFCPCHLPITFPSMVILTVGFGLGVWLSSQHILVATESPGGFEPVAGVIQWATYNSPPNQPQELKRLTSHANLL